jgi:hypothetical protein
MGGSKFIANFQQFIIRKDDGSSATRQQKNTVLGSKIASELLLAIPRLGG